MTCALGCFTHRLPNGAEYLFIARDDTDVLSWVASINTAIQATALAPHGNPLDVGVGYGKFVSYDCVIDYGRSTSIYTTLCLIFRICNLMFRC